MSVCLPVYLSKIHIEVAMHSSSYLSLLSLHLCYACLTCVCIRGRVDVAGHLSLCVLEICTVNMFCNVIMVSLS